MVSNNNTAESLSNHGHHEEQDNGPELEQAVLGLTREEFLNLPAGAVVDLDGVITSNQIHFQAWERVLNAYLDSRANAGEGGACYPLSREEYLKYLDSVAPYDALEDFLAAREIDDVPLGKPEDDPNEAGASITICRIANSKEADFRRILEAQETIEIYPQALSAIKEMVDQGIQIIIASTSRNAKAVMDKAIDPESGKALSEIFHNTIDGHYARKAGVSNNRDLLRKAAELIGTPPHRTVVVAGSRARVKAAREDNFGLIIGLARDRNHEALRRAGADIIAAELDEVSLESIDQWFAEECWRLTLRGEDLNRDCNHPDSKVREKNMAAAMAHASVFSIGNGFACTRGADPEPGADRRDYQAVYLAGVLDELPTEILLRPDDPTDTPRTVRNEDLVRCVNWTPITFQIDKGEWFDPTRASIVSGRKTLSMQDGSLTREIVVRDDQGRMTAIVAKACMSMADPHAAAQEYTITPLNYSGNITVCSGLHGDHINAGVARYAKYDQLHLQRDTEYNNQEDSAIVVTTTDSKIKIATAARLLVRLNGEEISPRYWAETGERFTQTFFKQRLNKGDSLEINKVVGISISSEGASDSTSPDRMQSSNERPVTLARIATKRSGLDYDTVHAASAQRWKDLWRTMDVRVEGGDRLTQQLLRLNLYHLIIAASPCITDLKLDVGIGPRGNTGETYRGHTFWDTEIFILPIVIAQQPQIARQLLEYRYKRLDEARKYASEHSYLGAMFPWNSGLVGNEQTQTVKENPVSHQWDQDNSRLQRHVALAVAHGIWNYHHITGDTSFLQEGGAEMFLEICRFWASAAERDSKTGKYSIAGVMGPDEFHEKYPNAAEGGVRDNAYTNIMVSWAMEEAVKLFNAMSPQARLDLQNKIGLNAEEWERWSDIRSNLKIYLSEDGIVEQFDGFSDLKKVSDKILKEAAEKYHGRVDRLLKARGDSTDRFQCAKQADFLMAPWVLGEERCREILERLLGRTLEPDWLKRNYEFYVARTAHGSTLSRLVHGEIALRANLPGEGVTLYEEALGADFHDLHENTGEGIHTGVMVGTVWQAMSCFGGLDLKGEVPSFAPRFPASWSSIEYGFTFRGRRYEVRVTPDSLNILAPSEEDNLTIMVQGEHKVLKAGEWNEFPMQPNVIGEPPLPNLH